MNAIGRYFCRRWLNNANKVHIEYFPQIACYSFDLITRDIHLDGQFERDQLELLSRAVFPNLPKRSICLDVGANIGNHSLHFAKYFERVIAFEPHPRIFSLLAVNAQLSEAILPLNLGASSAARSVDAFDNGLNLGATSIERKQKIDRSLVRFDLVRIDDLSEVQSTTPISFIKLDIEGHEVEAIRGARQTIVKNRPVIMLEVLAEEISDGTAAALEALRKLGYDFFYEPVEAGMIARLPVPMRKLARVFYTVFTLKRPSKAGRLIPIVHAEKRNYPMVLCSFEQLTHDGTA